MKIAVIGPGALGGYYGAKLSRAGRDVTFLLRSDYEEVRRNGVQVISPEGNFRARPRCARTPGEIGPVDLVLIALKTTANRLFATLLPGLVGPGTAILTLQNGLGNEEALAALFPVEQILGGLCFVCINRTAPGTIEHLAHGRVVMGEFRRWPEPRTHDIAGMFRHAGIPCDVSDSLERAHWEKLVWNIPFNGLGVASVAGLQAMRDPGAAVRRLGEPLTTDRLLGDRGWEETVRALMREVIGAANAQGLKIPASMEEKQVVRTREMGAYRPSTLIDFERGQELEMEALFLEPLRRARAAGVRVPMLERLCEVLSALGPAAAR